VLLNTLLRQGYVGQAKAPKKCHFVAVEYNSQLPFRFASLLSNTIASCSQAHCGEYTALPQLSMGKGD
jgi:hypothetical protein